MNNSTDGRPPHASARLSPRRKSRLLGLATLIGFSYSARPIIEKCRSDACLSAKRGHRQTARSEIRQPSAPLLELAKIQSSRHFMSLRRRANTGPSNETSLHRTLQPNNTRGRMAVMYAYAVPAEIIEPLFDLLRPILVGRSMEIGKVHVANSRDRPTIASRPDNRC